MLNGRDLVTALILGVLLPAIIARPEFLASHPMRDHVRARWEFIYSVFAFAAASFVFVSATELFGRGTHLSGGEKGALGGAGLLIFFLLCAHHVPPLVAVRKRAVVRVTQVALAVSLGVLMGGFFA